MHSLTLLDGLSLPVIGMEVLYTVYSADAEYTVYNTGSSNLGRPGHVMVVINYKLQVPANKGRLRLKASLRV